MKLEKNKTYIYMGPTTKLLDRTIAVAMGTCGSYEDYLNRIRNQKCHFDDEENQSFENPGEKINFEPYIELKTGDKIQIQALGYEKNTANIRLFKPPFNQIMFSNFTDIPTDLSDIIDHLVEDN